MKKTLNILLQLILTVPLLADGIRPPSTPLLTVDPYFSLWSQADEAYADVTRHWSGWKQPLLAAVRVDGKVFRILGNENFVPMGYDEYSEGRETREHVKVDEWYYKSGPAPVFTEHAEQLSRSVLPTRTVYSFRCGGVELEMCFTAPLLLDDVELLSRPVNYLSWSMRSADGRRHAVQLYLEASPRFAVDVNVQPVRASRGKADGVEYVKVGTTAQPVLEKRGDDIRIDWGYFYLATEKKSGAVALARSGEARRAFAAGKAVSCAGDEITSDNFEKDELVLTYSRDLGKVGSSAAYDYVMLAYDDVRSIRYLKEHELRPYWNRRGDSSLPEQLTKAVGGRAEIMALCEAFDASLLTEAEAAGGVRYADLCALAYRQAVSAHKLVESPKGELFFFSKENFSNGCCGTVDVTYPSVPLFLLYNPEIAKALVNFIFDYSEGPKWNKTWAPHDVGRYPDAYGQHYGNWMPLEESGNLLLLTAAIVKVSGDVEYARRHWPALTTWALYCVGHGQNPENTLCTDDFAGKLAHNANLSAKSILGVAAYARMAELLGKEEESQAYMKYARSMAAIWEKEAFEKDHYKLAFDLENSWSQKYNLVWDRVLGLNVFNPGIAGTEISWYLEHQNRYGLPLDSRRQYTKTDWIMWTATMASDREEFQKFVDPVWDFYNETPDRVPLCDWVNTEEPTKQGMIARSVVGGFFMKMLYERLK